MSEHSPKHYLDLSQNALQRTLPDATLQITQLPGVEAIRLALINADFQTGPLPAEVMQAAIAKPAYWAFCWGSGLALASWTLQQPELVAGKRVADVGCGCGDSANAAAMAGAAQVIACDNDPDALLVSRANADLNAVSLTYCADVADLPSNLDLVFLADVLYDRSNYPLLQAIKRLSSQVLVADSRIGSIDDPSFQLLHTSQALTYPNLGEFDEFKNVRFFRSGTVTRADGSLADNR